MNRKQFFVAIFTALIGAKRWRNLFPIKRNWLVNPNYSAYLNSSMSMSSLFNPSKDLHKLYLTGRIENIRWDSRPKIGCMLNIKRPVRYADKLTA